MAKQLQLRRGTTAQHATFTGAVGEVTIDTDKDVVVVHDGATAGGFPSQKQLVSGTNIKTINDTTLLGSGNISIGVSSLSDTSISSPLSGQVLSYNGDNWENVTFSALDAYSKEDTDILLAAKAPLASPALTGTPTAPTATAGTNTTQIATTEFVLANGTSAATLVPTSYFDISQLVSGSVTTLNIPNIFAFVNTTFVNITSVSININATTYWDNSTYATPANRAGKDFYIYVLSDGTIKLSINSTYPTGSDANNSRKIGGFHTLCNSVGTISGHTLSGYVTGDILPRSVWDLYNRAVAGNEGMVKNPNGKWVDIYLPSWNGTKLVSVYGGTIADGASSPAFHCYKFEQKFGEIGKDTISQRNFVVASLGSNQSTNVTGSNDKGTTGGWTDTAGRRMISNIGCEDMCGLMWQWCSDTGGYTSGSSWANAFDGNDSGVGGQHYGAPYRGLLGGSWGSGAICGSRGSYWIDSVLGLYSDVSARGCSEPSKNKLV